MAIQSTETISQDTPKDQAAGPRIERFRREPKRRSLVVESTGRVTPGMVRITFSGDELADFESLGFDDHVKISVPTPSGEMERRDYTPRRYDTSAKRLVVDFAVHDAGPVTQWALGAKPGDTLQVGGPRGSAVVSADVTRWLLIGDETALPAIGRRIEEASAGTQIVSVVAVTGPGEQQSFETSAELTTLWAHRPSSAAADPAALLSVVKTVELKPGTFVWIAAEGAVARAIRNHLVQERGYPLSWIKAAGYWAMGKADADKSLD
jgi:NADPH-dependent ferric siderophore reductase